jgi:hypothetical protein
MRREARQRSGQRTAIIFRFARKVNFPAIFTIKPNAAVQRFRPLILPFALYFMLYLTGTMRLTLDPISGGNNRPLAFRAISRAAWSRAADPELLTICADMTWPLRPIVRASRTVP